MGNLRKFIALSGMLALAGFASAQVSLTSTTLSVAIPTATAQQISVASVAGILVNNTLFIDREAMQVLAIAGNVLTVARGQSPVVATAHVVGAAVLAGPGNQFYYYDPAAGTPCTLTSTAVTPWVNLQSGNQWTCTGSPTVWTQSGAGVGGVSSFNTRTGAVVPASGDYTVSEVTGAAPLASPTFTGTPAAPTPATSDNSTTVATTAYVKAQAASAGAVTQIAQTTLATAASSVTFAAIPGTYSSLMLVISTGSTYTSFDNLKLVINADTNSDYLNCQVYTTGATPAGTCSATATTNIGYSLSANSAYPSSFTIMFPNYASTGLYKTINAQFGGWNGASGSGQFLGSVETSTWKSTSAITGIVLTTANAANFVAGSQFTLYGFQ